MQELDGDTETARHILILIVYEYRVDDGGVQGSRPQESRKLLPEIVQACELRAPSFNLKSKLHTCNWLGHSSSCTQAGSST